MKAQKISGVVLVLAIASMLLLGTNVCSAQTPITVDVVPFLRDVAGLDVAIYDVEKGPVFGPVPGVDPDLVITKYTLVAKGSRIETICHLKNNVVVWCKLYPIEGFPVFAQALPNSIDVAKNILEKYEEYSGVSHLQPMRNMLNTINDLMPMTKIANDITLETTNREGRETINWMRTVNGITNTYDAVVLSLRNGMFEFFCDEWNRCSIGNTDVRIEQEQAILTAKSQAQNRIRQDVGVSEASTYAFVSEHALLTMQPRGNMLYPHWEILLGLDKSVLSYGSALRILVWADTGEVSYITYSGSYGVPSNQSSAPSSSTASNDNFDQSFSVYLIAGTIATATLFAIAIVAVKKRRK